MPLMQTVDEISDLAFGYMASKALFAALELEVFSHIENGATTLQQLVAAAGVPENRLITLLTALTCVGLIEVSGNEYRNGPASARYLVAGHRDFYGDYLRMQINRQMYPFMSHLEAVMQGQTDKAPFDSYASWMADEAEAELYSRSQHTGSLGAGAVLARAVDFSDIQTLLDVGGGSGAMSIALCKRQAQLQATVLDFPHVTEVGKRFVREAELEAQVTFQPGNALSDEWPTGQDAILMSYLLSSIPGDTIPNLLQRAYDTLTPNGHIVLHDFILDDDRQGPKMTALWALQHVVFTPGAVSMTQADLTGRLDQIGFTDINTQDLLPGLTRFIHARKPASA